MRLLTAYVVALAAGGTSGSSALAFSPPAAAARIIVGRTATSPLSLSPIARSQRSRKVVLAPTTRAPRKTTWVQNNRASTALSAAASATNRSGDSTTKNTFVGTSLLIIIDIAIRRLFRRCSIAFPSSLAGCFLLLSTLLGINTIKSEWADKAYNALAPGAALLAKWLPVFFVPSLITLPLAPSLGSGAELAKLAAAIVGGFLFTLFTTAGAVLAVRKVQGGGSSDTAGASSREEDMDLTRQIIMNSLGTDDSDVSSEMSPSPSPPPKAFSDSTARGLTVVAAASGVLAATTARAGSSLGGPLQSIYMLFTTLSTFVFGSRLPQSFKKAIHPLVTCTALTWLGAKLLSFATEGTMLSVLESYKTGILMPPLLAGAGDFLLFMLGPSVVAFACQMYDRKKLMKENILEVSTGVGVSAVGGLFGTAALVRAFGLASPVTRLCLLSRNITSPLAMSIASMVGADISLAVSMVVITGLIGANFGAAILDATGIKDPVARGLGMGAAAHGLGTAAFANEKDAFPFSAISMALTGALTNVLVTLPAMKKAAVSLALGGV